MHPIMHLLEIRLSHASPDYLPVRHSVPRDVALVSSERRLRLAWGAATLGGDIPKFCYHVVRSRWDGRGLEAVSDSHGFLFGCHYNPTERYDSSRTWKSDGIQPDAGDRSERVRFDRH